MFGKSRVLLFISLVLCSILLFESTAFAAEKQTILSESIYHTHVGDGTSEDGCYIKVSSAVKCTGTVTSVVVSSHTYYNKQGTDGCKYGTCGSCGKYHAYCVQCGIGYSCNSYTCHGHTSKTYQNRCNKCGAVDIPVGACTSVIGQDVYELGCNLEETDIVGTIGVCKLVDGSAYSLEVMTSGSVTINSVIWSNGDSSSVCNVTGNGVYTCVVEYTEGIIVSSVTFSYEVSDYDTQPPVVQDVMYDNSRSYIVVFDVGAIDNYSVTEYKLEK